MNIYVAITTYNREVSYRKLLKDIQRTKGHHSVSVTVYDDCSDNEYVNKEDGNFVYRFDENQGIPIKVLSHKRGWFNITGSLFQDTSIYNTYKDRNDIQCNLINDIAWK